MELTSNNQNEDMNSKSHNSDETLENLEDHEEKKKIIEDFLNFTHTIAEKAKNNDETLNAITQMLKNSKNLKTESSLNSDLHCFCKFNGFFNIKKRKRKILVGSRKIGVQCTALARRKTLYGGRSSVQPGRPPKRSFVKEHGYSQMMKSTLLPNRKKPKIPHKLSESIENYR